MNKSISIAFVVAFLWSPPGCRNCSDNSQHHWQDTAAEQISVQRYSNCDHGYYVDLPDGFVAHGAKPPSPNHGFVINLADPGNTADALSKTLSRRIFVSNTANYQDLPSLNAIVESELHSMKAEATAFRVLERVPTKLGGLDATLVRVRYQVDAQNVDELDIFAYRSPRSGDVGDNIYVLGLITPESMYSSDKEVFDKIRQGFHLTGPTTGSCSND